MTPINLGSQKRYHEITKLGGDYSPFQPSNRVPDYREAYKGWVYTAVSVIAGGVAKLPYHLLSDSEKQIEHPYIKLIDYSLLEAITSYLKLSGTVYIWKNIIGGQVRSLTILRPDIVEPQWDKSKTVILGYKYNLNGKTIPFKAEEIIPIMNFNPLQAYPYQTSGFSDIQAGAISIDTDNAQSLWNWKEFENGATPGAILSTDSDLKKEKIDEMRESWYNKFKGVNNAKKLAILTNGLKFTQASLSQKDTEFIEGKKLTRDEILSIFKVPKAILGLGDGSGGNMNIRSFQEIFARNAIEPVAIRIRDAFNKYLFAGIGYFEFYNIIPNDETIVRADYTSGIITLNEARGMRGFKPLKGGDIFYLDAISAPQDTQPPAKGIETDEGSLYKSIADNISGYMVPGEKSNELKIKKRDKRLVKFETLIANAVKDIAEQQLKDIISQIKDEKALKVPPLNFKKYSSIWLIKLKPIYTTLVDQEGTQALKDAGLATSFQVGAPEVSKLIKDNIYLLSSSVDQNTKEKLSKIFDNGINEGIGAEEMKNRVMAEFENMKSSRAETISRTETIRMSNEASIEAWGQSGVVSGKEWVTAKDDRVSEICASLDGKIIPLNGDYFKKGDKLTIGDKTFNMDYSDTAGPPSHPNCRCTLVPIIKD